MMHESSSIQKNILEQLSEDRIGNSPLMKERKGGLQEKLTMAVAFPYLWGVPPAAESLHLAVRTGGGIVDKLVGKQANLTYVPVLLIIKLEPTLRLASLELTTMTIVL
ncbi:hypothetical protein YC2023_028280 [Brassica napus]